MAESNDRSADTPPRRVSVQRIASWFSTARSDDHVDDKGRPSLERQRSSFFREPSRDDESLRVERFGVMVPFSKSPFTPGQDEYAEELTVEKIGEGGMSLRWSDLLLEIAMTTAFASLTDGTDVLNGADVFSYLSFFALVYWVWASQVLFNIRYRQVDWLQRFWALCLLIIFGGLAAFTNNFDITFGIGGGGDDDVKTQFEESDGFSQASIDAANFRDNRLPKLNDEGISVVMAVSRLFLLLQYIVVLHQTPGQGMWKKLRSRCAIALHIYALFSSFVLYLIAIAASRKITEPGNAAKIFLWFFPIVVEAIVHYLAVWDRVRGRVEYEAEAAYENCSSLFIIVLGGGLDQATKGFTVVVGNVSLGGIGRKLIIAAIIIFVTQFSLYFTMASRNKQDNKRVLTVVLLHFVYVCALIILLRGMATLLQAAYINTAMNLPLDLLDTLLQVTNDATPNTLVDYNNPLLQGSHLEKKLSESGIALTDLVTGINNLIQAYTDIQKDATLALNPFLQATIYTTIVILENTETMPDSNSALYAHLFAFVDAAPDNGSIVNYDQFIDLVEGVFLLRANPARWFYASAGIVLFCLVAMGMLKRTPRDRYEWGQTMCRLILGIVLICMSALDIHSQELLNALQQSTQANIQGFDIAKIWHLAYNDLVLPPLAALLALEQIVEFILVFVAARVHKELSKMPPIRLKKAIHPRTWARLFKGEPDEILPGAEFASSPITASPTLPYIEENSKEKVQSDD